MKIQIPVWSAVVEELILYKTQEEIGKECACSQSHLSLIRSKKNKSPSWEIGEKLRQLLIQTKRRKAKIRKCKR